MATEITAKTLIFTAEEPEENGGHQYSFEGWELPTGEVVISYDGNADGWYASREEVDACGMAMVVSVEESPEHASFARIFTQEDLRNSITASARDYGDYGVPKSLHKYIEQENAA